MIECRDFLCSFSCSSYIQSFIVSLPPPSLDLTYSHTGWTRQTRRVEFQGNRELLGDEARSEVPQVSLHSLSFAAPPLSLSLCVSVCLSLSLSARSEVPQVSLHSLSFAAPPPPPLSLSLSVSLSVSLSARSEVPQVSLHSLFRCPLSLSLSLSLSLYQHLV